MNNQTVLRQLQNYFTSKGLELHKTESGFLQFTDNEKIIAVYFLLERSYTGKNQLLDLMLEATSRILNQNQTYIAIPKLYGSILDTKHLESNGLGLILYDERGLYEVLAARYIDHIKRDSVDLNIRLESEIRKLRLEIDGLKRNLMNLKNELDDLRDIKIIEKAVQPIDQPATQRQIPVQEDDLPSFFKDNPWITVLSKRGTERLGGQ